MFSKHVRVANSNEEVIAILEAVDIFLIFP